MTKKRFSHTLGKKRNATEFTVVIFSLLLTGLVVLGDSFIRHVIELFYVFIQAERHLFQCVIPEFGVSHGWSVVTSSVCCFNRLFLLLIAWSGGRILPDFSFVSGHRGLHNQGELKEGIRMLMANILQQCIAGSFGVHRRTICCHRLRLCETRKNSERLRSIRPQIDRYTLPFCNFIFAEKTNIHFIKGNENSFYHRNEVGSHHGSLCSEP